jgi:hypothetical protein
MTSAVDTEPCITHELVSSITNDVFYTAKSTESKCRFGTSAMTQFCATGRVVTALCFQIRLFLDPNPSLALVCYLLPSSSAVFHLESSFRNTKSPLHLELEH